ncbi:carboxylesterase/lipase family protein [uncultured Amnibacterium sp.]|uniref:carboxylesterase/lipase family protein n=1 Tax=uncultured Amnibacterium sp. TaxID=1631851 RepID=UPI0035CAE4B0
MTDQPIIDTTAGPVQGRAVEGVERYLGVPYAAAPFGALRFLAPQAHAPWIEPFQADRFGPTAPQKEGASPGGLPDVIEPIIAGDEILNLNVWTPVDRSGPLPVLLWIHGGGFFAGCSANPWYDGTSFARQGLVFVSCNYRFGAEGFLELEGAPANRGVLDWIAALEWIRDNIAAFGGDPAAVTIMGQSAGGMAVSALLSAPAAERLFHRAIIASGVSASSIWSRDAAIAVAEDVTQEAGIARTLEGARSATPNQIIAAHERVNDRPVEEGGSLMPPWAPVVDGALLDGDLFDAVAQGRSAGIPVLVGSTANEFAWMTYRDRPDDEEAKAEGQQLFADELFRLPIQRFADARADAGAAPTFRYEFQWKSSAAPYIRAGHSLDIPFCFHTLDAAYVLDYTGPNPPVALADEDHDAFAAFARTGDPGWPAYERAGAVKLFDTPSRVGTVRDLGLPTDSAA